MIKEGIVKRLEDAIADIFIELEGEIKLEPDTENIYLSVERSQLVEQLANNMVLAITDDIKQMSSKNISDMRGE